MIDNDKYSAALRLYLVEWQGEWLASTTAPTKLGNWLEESIVTQKAEFDE